MNLDRRTLLKTTGAATSFSLVGATSSIAADGSGTEQFRAFWVDAFNEGIYDHAQVQQLVNDAIAANHNAVIAQVIRRADCFCNDGQPPRTDAPIDEEPYDPLEALLEEAHAAGLEVHAWMNINTMWNQPDPPADENHPFNTHGPDSDEPWVSVREDGEVGIDNNYFFDPGHPAVAKYLTEAARSIVENYDIDGVNLDYVRYPDHNLETGRPSWGYNDVAVERFKAETGRDDVPEADDEEWAQWRRDQVTNLVRRIYLECFEADPSVCVSVNTVTFGEGPPALDGGFEDTMTYQQALQDFRTWMEEGIVDLHVPMNYKRDWMDDQAKMYRDWNEFIADHQYDRHAVIGSAVYLNEIEDSVEQVRAALSPTDNGNEVVGWTAYSYATPDLQTFEGERPAEDAREDLRRALTDGSEFDDADEPVFAEPAAVPEMTWKTDPDYGHLQGVVTTRDGDPLDAIVVEVFDGGETVTETQTTGNGWFGVVDLEPGTYRVALDPGSVAGQRTDRVTIEAGKLADVEFEVRGRVPPRS